jgi:hypothetical protein
MPSDLCPEPLALALLAALSLALVAWLGRRLEE